jgi:hypothetical protein
MLDRYKYEVEVVDGGVERTVSCVNLFKHRLYRGLVQTRGKGTYTCLFEILVYPLNYKKSNLATYFNRLIRKDLFDLTELSHEGIATLRETYPLELLHQAFKVAVPELYLYNKRVSSNKYKILVSNYLELEDNYIRRLETFSDKFQK